MLVICKGCGTQFDVNAFQVKKGHGKWCSRLCYRRWLASPEVVSERFWSKVDRSGECWLWTASTTRTYGHFVVSPGVSGYAHRFAYEQAYGPIPAGLSVCHRCDTPLCVRPDHLFLGTQQDNMLDRDAKGRVRYGEAHGGARLTADDVREIRRLYATGQWSYRTLAELKGVTHALIWRIVAGKAWTHVQ